MRAALVGRCKVYASDLKVRIEATDLSTFPDASVVCGELQTAAKDGNAATNPAIVVEVTVDLGRCAPLPGLRMRHRDVDADVARVRCRSGQPVHASWMQVHAPPAHEHWMVQPPPPG